MNGSTHWTQVTLDVGISGKINVRIFLALLILLAANSASSLAAAQTSSRYTIREDTVLPGSIDTRAIGKSTDIPINETYAELSAADKAEFRRSNYLRLPDADEPPFPKSGLQALLKPIALGQQKLQVTGKLLLVGVVDPSGKVLRVSAVGSPSPEMTKFASEVMLLTPFKPALCAGKPCTMEFPLHLQFGAP
jgi:hypothetical protein